MRVLTFTSLYPRPEAPEWGVFVETRLAKLLEQPGVRGRVVVPVPWFPFRSKRFGRFAAAARTPLRARRRGIDVRYVRYPTLPLLTRWIDPFLMALGALGTLRTLRDDGDLDVIDAHFFYPDGVAAVVLGALLRRPVVITGRGTDLNHLPRRLGPRLLIRWAAARAAGIITVCRALARDLAAIGVPETSVTVLRNGVDLDVFRPFGDRASLRADLGVDAPLLLSVGHLIDRKGHDLVVRALDGIPGAHLAIAGRGPRERALRALVGRLGVSDRVRFLGALPQDELARWYAAADVLVLASSREGWANVLLEAMACGTPVVATDVGGTREALAGGPGILLTERSPQAIAEGVKALLARPELRRQATAHARRFTWDAVGIGVREVLERAAASRSPSALGAPGEGVPTR